MKLNLTLYLIAYTVSSLKIQPITNIGIQDVFTKIVVDYFSHLHCIFVIAETNNTFLHNDLENYRLPSEFRAVIEEESDILTSSSNVKQLLKTAVEQACIGFVVQISKPDDFLNIWKSVSKAALHRHNPRVLLLPTSKNSNVSGKVLGNTITDFIVDMTMVDLTLSRDQEQTLEMVTANWDMTKSILTTCKVSECLNLTQNLFPNKFSNLQNKELKVATFTYLPYSIIEPLDGTEVRIAQEYASRRNCSLSVVTDRAQWGQIFENGTGDGILGTVAEERADVGLGALYLWYHEYQFLDFSVPYIRTGVTCLAPKPHLLSALLFFIKPFTLFTWLLLIIILCLASVSLFLTKKIDILIKEGVKKVKKQRRRHNSWFTTTADTALRTLGFLVMQGSSNQLIEVHSIRHLVNCLHVMFLLVTTAYTSGLTSIFTVPPSLPPIDSVQDLVSSGLSWGATHDAWIFSLREATEPDMRTLVARFRALPRDRLHGLSLTEDFVFSVERLPAGHFAIGDYITDASMKHLRLMKQDIYYEHCTIVFQKGSPFTDSFNQLIHRLLTSGLLLLWEGEVARKFLPSSIQSAVRDSTMALYRPRHTALHVAHVQGAFFLLVTGLGAALLVFVWELLIGSCRHKKHQRVKKTVTFKLYPDKDMTQYEFVM